MNRRKIMISLSAAATLALAVGYHARGARASGIPTTNTLAYTGTLLNGGQPDDGQHFIQINLWVMGASSPACTTPANGKTQLSDGRFTIPLDPSCVPVIHQNPNVQVEVVIDGGSMGKTPLSAVPYAAEADTASNFAPGSAISNLVPPGTVVTYAGVVGGSVMPPPGWLLCDGSTVTRTTYANLFTAIGTGWGSGDGATTFNLPDLRGLVLRGVDPTAKNDPDAMARTAINPGGNTGAAVGSYEADAFAFHNHGGATGNNNQSLNHTHNVQEQEGEASGGSGFVGTMYSSNGPFSIGAQGTSGVNGGDLPHNHSIPQDGASSETRGRNAAVNYIVKY
jgi:microcystin-dependent protein